MRRLHAARSLTRRDAVSNASEAGAQLNGALARRRAKVSDERGHYDQEKPESKAVAAGHTHEGQQPLRKVSSSSEGYDASDSCRTDMSGNRSKIRTINLDINISVMTLIDHFERLTSPVSSHALTAGAPIFVPPKTYVADKAVVAEDPVAFANRTANATVPSPPPPENSPLIRQPSHHMMSSVSSQERVFRLSQTALSTDTSWRQRQQLQQQLQLQLQQQQQQQQQQQTREKRRRQKQSEKFNQESIQVSLEHAPRVLPRLHPSASQKLDPTSSKSNWGTDFAAFEFSLVDKRASSSSSTASSFDFNSDNRRMASVQVNVLEEDSHEVQRLQPVSHITPPPSPQQINSVNNAKLSPGSKADTITKPPSLLSVPSAPLPPIVFTQHSLYSAHKRSTNVKSPRAGPRPPPAARAVSAMTSPQDTSVVATGRHHSALDSQQLEKASLASARDNDRPHMPRQQAYHVPVSTEQAYAQQDLQSNSPDNDHPNEFKKKHRRIFGMSTEKLRRLGQKFSRKSAR